MKRSGWRQGQSELSPESAGFKDTLDKIRKKGGLIRPRRLRVVKLVGLASVEGGLAMIV